jgi:zinc/manganese transport system permease protein
MNPTSALTPALHPVDWSIVGPALIAGLLVLATHVPLGLQVLRKGIVFIDLAIAQIAGLGVILADTLGFEPQGWAVQASAVSAALAGAALLTWTEKRWPDIQEALIGGLFVVTSCIGLLMLSGNPHGGEHLKDLLVGQILWVSAGQLQAMAALTAVVLALWWCMPDRHARTGFYVLFALAVTASVQLVGVYLVFSSLIMPALAVRELSRRRPAQKAAWLTAYALGAVSYGAGLALSAMLDWPSGAVVVVVMAMVCVLASLWMPKSSAPAAKDQSLANRVTPPT